MTVPSRLAEPGYKVRHRTGDSRTIDRRKEDDSGWWLTDGSGLSDHAIDDGHWTIIAKAPPTPELSHALAVFVVEATAAMAADIQEMAEGRYTGRHCQAFLDRGLTR